ncbi:hypothetical protein A33Q_1487 [Indibacter alkaliphilus LW1]|jgi:hypothetical protein|uniref:DUF4236 domain-containing protein n=1 Tax=Indibacter alkaliphilus (strain CCUG 57479 / KCTC 22604 / LW1) TaxID=1189612 RepID=S2DLR0_INDAL|nr:DUF4236 domain-containing protein [Indibacter alkaliphilus]EOZ98125.1 hypothetical protein A33Q_1487 [Indibacter alkaliphilus LW1]
MAFYLRKGFNFGPLRVNLSKSGFGISGGVTGARIGINSQGRTYVHGGRHGLYYRKNLSAQNSRQGGQFNGGSSLDEEEIFKDTGLTYALDSKTVREPLVFPDIFKNVNATTLFSGIGLLLISLLVGELSIKLALAVIGLFLLIYYNKQRNRKNNLLMAFEEIKGLHASDQNANSWRQATENLDEGSQKAIAPLVLNCWLEKQLTDGEIFPIKDLLSFLPVEKSFAEKIAITQYCDAVEHVISDHQLTRAEESLIQKLELDWEIPKSEILAETALIAQFQHLRELQREALRIIEISRPLVANEKAYYEDEGRLLNQRILDTWQENKVRYKTVGYQLDMEGIIRISSRVLEIQEGRNIRSYPIRRVQDIYLNADAGTVEVVLEGRKNPLIISTPSLFKFAGILQKATTEEIEVS